MKTITLQPWNDPVVSLDWSPAGDLLGVVGVSGSCLILQVPTGRVTHRLSAHRDGAFCVDWSPRGPWVATSGQDGCIRLWSVANGALWRQFAAGNAWVEEARFSPSGEWIAGRAGRHLRVWRVEGDLALEFSGHESTVSALTWRADSKAVATCCYGRLRAWRLGETEPYEDISWKGAFLSLAWSPGGRFLCGGTQEGTIQFFRLPARQNEPLQMSGYPSKIRNLAWDQAGRWLASDGGQSVVVWDTSGEGPANTTPLQLEGHPGRISALAYQPSGPWLASGCDQGTVMIWDPPQRTQVRHAVRFAARINSLRWSRSGAVLAVGCQDGTVGLVASAP